MKISVGYIIAFIAGIGLLLLINFIRSQKDNSVKTNSGLYPMIYRSIEDKQSAIINLTTNEATVANYKKQLQSCLEVLNSIKFPSPSTMASATTQTLLNEGKNLREQLQKAFDQTRFNKYVSSYNSQSSVESTLSNIALDLNDNFSWTFDLLWSPGVNGKADSLSTTPGGTAFLSDLSTFLKDSAALKSKRDQLSSAIKTKIEQVDQLSANIKSDKDKIQDEIKSLDTSLNDIEQSSKDRMLMYVVIPLFGLIVVLLMVLPYIYKQNPDILGKLFEQKVILQIFTVFILVMAILLLGIGDKIKAETLGTLLGGISVYVLQKTMDGNESDRNGSSSK